jgi:hypothetical protein
VGQVSEQVLISDVATRLTDRYPDVPAETVATTVEQAYKSFDQSPIRDFIPLLVERQAGAELSKLAEPARA